MKKKNILTRVAALLLVCAMAVTGVTADAKAYTIADERAVEEGAVVDSYTDANGNLYELIMPKYARISTAPTVEEYAKYRGMIALHTSAIAEISVKIRKNKHTLNSTYAKKLKYECSSTDIFTVKKAKSGKAEIAWAGNKAGSQKLITSYTVPNTDVTLKVETWLVAEPNPFVEFSSSNKGSKISYKAGKKTSTVTVKINRKEECKITKAAKGCEGFRLVLVAQYTGGNKILKTGKTVTFGKQNTATAKIAVENKYLKKMSYRIQVQGYVTVNGKKMYNDINPHDIGCDAFAD